MEREYYCPVPDIAEHVCLAIVHSMKDTGVTELTEENFDDVWFDLVYNNEIGFYQLKIKDCAPKLQETLKDIYRMFIGFRQGV